MKIAANNKRVQTVRFMIQIIFFLFLPGFFASAFMGVKTLYLGIINHNLNVTLSIISLIEILAILPVTIFLGRFFCGWICSFGAIQDWLYKLIRKSIRVPEKTDRVLKSLKYFYLLALIGFVWKTDWKLLKSSNPWDAYGVIFAILKKPDLKAAWDYFMFGTLILAIIFGASIFIERFFCRYLCPLGGILSVSSIFRATRIEKEGSQCGKCTKCTKECSMGIPLYRMDKVKTGECILCMKCVNGCPRQNAKLVLSGEGINEAKTGIVVTASIAALFHTEKTLANDKIQISEKAVMEQSSTRNGTYIDGTYEGEADGFAGITKVKVIVVQGRIQTIDILSYEDDKEYFEKAQGTVIQSILQKQDTKVDTVSGATYSSNGIIKAVENALQGKSLLLAEGETDKNSDHIATRSPSTDEKGKVDDTKNPFRTTSPSISKTQSPKTDNGTSVLQTENPVSKETAPSNQTKTPSKETQKPLNQTKTPISNTTGSVSKTKEPIVRTAAPATKAPATKAPVVKTPAPIIKTPTPIIKTPTPIPTVPSTLYANGTFQGSGIGFKGKTTKLSVTMKNDIITDISVVSYGDTRAYFEHAFQKLVADILNKQSTNVDTVSGATYSSKGIKAAVNDALSKAKN